MKDCLKLKNYRTKYKRYYDIDFSSDYDIHHIDFDRTNNEIDNLILLPKMLHQKYHFLINSVSEIKLGEKIDYKYSSSYTIKILKEYVDMLEELEKWKMYKVNLELQKRTKEINRKMEWGLKNE